MTLFGFSDYQNRKSHFLAKQRLANNLRFKDRYFVAESLLAVFLGLIALLVGKAIFNNKPYSIGLCMLVLFASLELLTIPWRIKLWKRWYQNLDTQDRQEYWWIVKRHIQYTALALVSALTVLTLLIIGNMKGWLA